MRPIIQLGIESGPSGLDTGITLHIAIYISRVTGAQVTCCLYSWKLKSLRNGKVYNWETATYDKILYDEDVHYLRLFETEFPAIVYNDALAYKPDFSSEPTVSPQHIDEVNLNNETSLSEYDGEEYNVLSFNDLFPFNVFSINDSKLDIDNDDDKIDIKQSLRDISIEPSHNVISIDVGTSQYIVSLFTDMTDRLPLRFSPVFIASKWQRLLAAVPDISGGRSAYPEDAPRFYGGEGGDRELAMVGEFVGELLGEKGGEGGRRFLCLQERKDSDTWDAIGLMFKVVYSINDEVREIKCCGGSNAKENIGFISRHKIFVNFNGTYDVLMNEKMCRHEIRTYLFNEEIAWILKYKLEPV
nr:hypothetical protein [Tanacetum cinerariifolium]